MTRIVDVLTTETLPAGLGIPEPAGQIDEETHRHIPRASWGTTVVVALLLTVAGVTVWEMRMRAIGLRAADLDDTNADWAAARRDLANGPPDRIAIVGDSRIWFDTDLDVWEEMIGERPIQLALQGTAAAPFLQNLADDERFRGLAVVGIAELVNFSGFPPLRIGALAYASNESLSQRFGHQVYRQIAPWFAFLDQQYTPQILFRWINLPNRAGVIPPQAYPWKLSEQFAGRQTFMWPRVIEDAALRDATRRTWMGLTKILPPPTDALIDGVIASFKRDVDRIRARGGDVVFVRPPSDGEVLAFERTAMPRARAWDRLIAETGTLGVHWEDHRDMQGLAVPEWSHLTRESANRFTRAYVRVIAEQSRWLRDRVSRTRTP